VFVFPTGFLLLSLLALPIGIVLPAAIVLSSQLLLFSPLIMFSLTFLFYPRIMFVCCFPLSTDNVFYAENVWPIDKVLSVVFVLQTYFIRFYCVV
jgi:hypothetical protein